MQAITISVWVRLGTRGNAVRGTGLDVSREIAGWLQDHPDITRWAAVDDDVRIYIDDSLATSGNDGDSSSNG